MDMPRSDATRRQRTPAPTTSSLENLLDFRRRQFSVHAVTLEQAIERRPIDARDPRRPAHVAIGSLHEPEEIPPLPVCNQPLASHVKVLSRAHIAGRRSRYADV